MPEIHVDLNPVMSLFPPDGGLPHTADSQQNQRSAERSRVRTSGARKQTTAGGSGKAWWNDSNIRRGRGAFPRPPGKEPCLVVEVKLR